MFDNIMSMFSALADLYGPTRLEFKQTNDRVIKNARIANKNVLAQCQPSEIKPGWLQRAARNRKTWAKPKGWRMRGI